MKKFGAYYTCLMESLVMPLLPIASSRIWKTPTNSKWRQGRSKQGELNIRLCAYVVIYAAHININKKLYYKCMLNINICRSTNNISINNTKNCKFRKYYIRFILNWDIDALSSWDGCVSHEHSHGIE